MKLRRRAPLAEAVPDTPKMCVVLERLWDAPRREGTSRAVYLRGSSLILADLRRLEIIGPQLHQRTVRELDKLGYEQFGKVDDVIRQAARIPVGRGLTPERVLATCTLGLAEIFEGTG